MSTSVLIADDVAPIRQLFEFGLGERYDVETVSNGQACWEYLRDRPTPDVLVLDVMMPGLDGLVVLDRVRNDDALSDLPVILLSASELAAAAPAWYAGVVEHVSKPVSPRELAGRIERLTG